MTKLTRNEAEKRLKELFKIDHFYDEQWTAIDRIMRGERVLMIERTGFGKSLCYQFPATQFNGVTVIFSPLIALMRDQVRSLNEKGISAAYINSEQARNENSAIIRRAQEGKIKILYIAPERQEDREWIEAAKSLKLSMVVIDEAHTISTWGHDFRPAFRRIIDLVQLLPNELPVLAVTATATKRVQKDIEKQIGGKLSTIRGDLARPNLCLRVLRVQSEDEKMIWLAGYVDKLPGTGIIYAGTRAQSETYALWLQHMGINAVEYHAGLDGETRKELERGFIDNRWKCIISTNALGMGIDKPDIRFIIHTHIPVSPINYYQEIGRAGRDGRKANIILFYNESRDPDSENEKAADYRLPRSLIDGSRPSENKYRKVIELLKERPLSFNEIIKQANLKSTQLRTIKADLLEQGIAKEAMYGNAKKLEFQYGCKDLDISGFEALRKAKLADLDAMIRYVYTEEPRMKFLCDFLDCEGGGPYSNCDNTNLKKLSVLRDDDLYEKLSNFRDANFPELKLSDQRTIIGYAASYYGDSAVGKALHRCKYEDGGNFPDFLLKKVLSLYRKKLEEQDFDLILYVPPTVSGELMKDFAARFSKTAGIPLSHDLRKTRTTNKQKVFQSKISKNENVKGAFDIDAEIVEGKKILLMDDIYDSGATLEEIRKLLAARGAAGSFSIVIAKTVGGTL